jgi:hypothetical protein
MTAGEGYNCVVKTMVININKMMMKKALVKSLADK